jgi:hypothetical protein
VPLLEVVRIAFEALEGAVHGVIVPHQRRKQDPRSNDTRGEQIVAEARVEETEPV